MKKQTIIYAVFGVLAFCGLVAGGLYLYDQSDNSKNSDTIKTEGTPKQELTGNETVSYQGEEGKTALELLQQNATIVTKGEGANAYVTTINGKLADTAKNEYWKMNVNGEMSNVGAGSYITKDTDTITWEFATWE